MLPDSHRVALQWLGEGRRVVAATLVEAVGSAPLDPGAEMLVDDTGRIEGSVTGGCIEGALVEESQGVLAGAPPRVATYGITDEQAADVGLMCGGTVRVFVHELGEPQRAALAATRQAIEVDRPVALTTLLDGPGAGTQMVVTEDGRTGSLGVTDLFDHNVEREARGFLAEGRSAVRRYSRRGEVMGADLGVAIRAFARPPSMIVFGAIDFSAALARLAVEIGYQVTIVDARAAFLQSPRFSQHAEVVVDWPDRYLGARELGPGDAVLVFTHDPKFDEPALMAALRSGAGYIGALGSRRAQADREERLRASGASEEDLARISAPCGLDLGARTPEETAIAVLGEVLALRAGRSGGRLADKSGPIHPAKGVPMARHDEQHGSEMPSEQRGGTTPDEAEAREKGEWGARAREGVVPPDLGGSDAPREMLADDPELESSVLGRTTDSDEPATEEGIDPSAGDSADAVRDGGPDLPPEGEEPDLKDVGAAARRDDTGSSG